uniref:Transmembrane protein 225 n=1 Tax=Sciurus vulgaris TaxID=55149 RepID=A0A8D2DQ83_SCIVU
MPVSNRNIQAANVLTSSWVVVFLVVGIIFEEWVELVPKTTNNETTKNKTIHNPWMICCTAIWPEDGLQMIRIMMISVLVASCSTNFILGLYVTYIIPQNKYIYLIITLFNFFTGSLLLSTLLLYNGMLRKGRSMYFSSFKITWVPITAYLAILLLVACGILSLLQYKVFANVCTCLKIHKSAKGCGSSIQVISLPERKEMPRSIVRMHAHSLNEETENKPQVQARRVTWAV